MPIACEVNEHVLCHQNVAEDGLILKVVDVIWESCIWLTEYFCNKEETVKLLGSLLHRSDLTFCHLTWLEI